MSIGQAARACLILASIAVAPGGAAAAPDDDTTTPIKHLIVVLGENRSFDHVFATYVPQPGQTIANLLSKGIVKPDGSPGPNFAAAVQYRAVVDGAYRLAPSNKQPYETLPPPNTGSAPPAPRLFHPPFPSRVEAELLDDGLPASDLGLLLSGATGLPRNAVDTRIADYGKLPPGPFRLTPGAAYDSYTGDPVHRFYQMWQQLDCDAARTRPENPGGCLGDLFVWVAVTAGNGKGKPPASPADDEATRQGGNAMGFYSMQQGDAPYLKRLADHFTLADNYHQAILGGSTANPIALATGDVPWFSDGGRPGIPPQFAVENPDPRPGTDNFYVNDGFWSGAFSNCSDQKAPGVGPILGYLAALPYHPKPNCAADTFYLLNNMPPGFLGDGSPNTRQSYHLPPSPLRTIGDALSARQISWKYYGESFATYLNDPRSRTGALYCAGCNPFQYAASIMTDAAGRAHLRDAGELYRDIAEGKLPAVAFVKPNVLNDGHPGSSKLDIFEAYLRRILETLEANQGLAAGTAVLVTFDESGGYYDSGYVQALDFFGDGPRVPLIAVSRFSTGGKIVHRYYDHVSILKFIERNWRLPPLTARSRDNLPNPRPRDGDPYVPANPPAIGDLMELFSF